MGDGKRVDAIDSRGVATARACRVVTGVSRKKEVASGEGRVARGGSANECRGKATAGGVAERTRLRGWAGGVGSCYMVA
jgi:hypothetical protein